MVNEYTCPCPYPRPCCCCCLCLAHRCEVKVIDLGSSCFITDHLSSYVQSRSYRAPEVILGLPYGQKIDIWSLGCILAELATGYVLFQVGLTDDWGLTWQEELMILLNQGCHVDRSAARGALQTDTAGMRC